MTKTKKKPTNGPSLKHFSIVTVMDEDEAQAVREAAASEGIPVEESPDLVLMWTGDVNRFEAGRDRAVIVEYTKDGGERVNAFPELESRTIDFVKSVYKYYGEAPTVDPQAEAFHEYNEAEGLTGRLVLLGDSKKFEDGGALHAVTFTRVLVARGETDPDAQRETFDYMRSLYAAGLEACNALRKRNGYTGGQ